jgi:hypothetical protein
MRLAVRLFISVLAVGLVFGMGVHYDVAGDHHWPYPDGDDLAEDYDAYVGDTTLLFGTVESVDESAGTARIRVEHVGGELVLTVRGFEVDVESGGAVQVFGQIEQGHTMTAHRIAVVNPSSGAEHLKFGLSGLGALLVLVAFFREWRVDWDAYAFRGR